MDKPNDQSSRWSSESNYPPQVRVLMFTQTSSTDYTVIIAHIKSLVCILQYCIIVLSPIDSIM